MNEDIQPSYSEIDYITALQTVLKIFMVKGKYDGLTTILKFDKLPTAALKR